MRIASASSRTTRAQRTTKTKATNQRAQRRRRVQRRRRFAQQMKRFDSILSFPRMLPALRWPHLRLAMPGNTGLQPSKLVSLALLITVVTLLVWFQQNESFFVYPENVHFSGNTYLSPDELYEACDVDSWSILWLDPETIREEILQHPYVADAKVQIRWPAQVSVRVTEVRPTALWVTDQGEYWLLSDGKVLPMRATFAEEQIRIIDGPQVARLPDTGQDTYVNAKLVQSAVALANRIPGLHNFWYSPSQGLNFGLPGTNTWVYWGNERYFEQKWQAIDTLRSEILANQDENLLLNLLAPSRPSLRRYNGDHPSTP